MTDAKIVEYQVLDHGYVRLIQVLGSDQSIIEGARMSTGKGFLGWDPRTCDCSVRDADGELAAGDPASCLLCKGTGKLDGDAKLLEFLWKNRHTSPFEMGELVFEVAAPIMVFREWHRHRTQSYNEFSARYAVMPNLHYVPELDRFRKKGANKQGSDGEIIETGAALDMRAAINDEQTHVYDQYQRMIDAGVATEVARINCPVARYSKMRAKANLLNWFRFLMLRMAPNAQYEIRQYAEAVAKIVKACFPRSYALFEEHTLYGVTLSRSEMHELRVLLGLPHLGGQVSEHLSEKLRKRLSAAERIGA